MRRFLLVLLIVVLFGAGIAVFFMRDNEGPIETVSDDEMVIEVVELPSEMKITDKKLNDRFEISEAEVKLIKEDKLIKLEYLEGIHRLVYDWNIDSNQLMFVFEDQTYNFNFNTNEVILNYADVISSNMFVKKLDGVYANLDELTNTFNIRYDIMEEPFFLLQIDINPNDEKSVVQLKMDGVRNALPEKINMTWEAVYSAKTNVSKLYKMPGLDVISPVWYDLEDGLGHYKSKKQDDYIQWADEMGYTLWPAITNNFDPAMTHDLITNVDNRSSYIMNLVNDYKTNQFPGINIDFENIYKADKDALSQFIAELTAAFHRDGMLVSIDVTFAGGSDNWSKCYDRTVLGEWVDFVVIMSYDEHWGSSPVSGSVASLNWLDKNLNVLIQEVEPQKVIMGIPFYMRIWFERPHKEVVNSMKVTSDAITMHKMESILASGDYNVIWDENAAQNYISFIDSKDNAVKKIWIEDEQSLRAKLTMVEKYNLKGVASWRRGYELESIWLVIQEVLKGE